MFAVASHVQELIYIYLCFAENGPEGAFSHIFGVVGKCDFASRRGVPPDFIASGPGTIETPPEGS